MLLRCSWWRCGIGESWNPLSSILCLVSIAWSDRRMKCGSCGRDNSSDAFFCDRCGNQVRFPRPPAKQPVRATPIRRDRRNPLVFSIIAVLGLITAFTGYFAYQSESHSMPDGSQFGFFHHFTWTLLWSVLALIITFIGILITIIGLIITVAATFDL